MSDELTRDELVEMAESRRRTYLERREELNDLSRGIGREYDR